MSATRPVFAAVRAVQGCDLAAPRRDALAQLLLALHVAIELDPTPGPEWRPAVAAFDMLLHESGPADDSGDVGGATVTRLRPCPGEGGRR